VVTALSTGEVPVYRETNLTYVLREILGGNAKCSVLVTCSPHEMQYHATENTLRFAERCKGIERVVSSDRKQMSANQLEEMVRKLQVELAHERERTEAAQTAAKSAEREVKRLRQEQLASGGVSSIKEASALQIRVVEEQSRYNAVAEDRDKLRAELALIRKQLMQAEATHGQEMASEHKKRTKLVDENRRNAAVIRELRDRNSELNEQVTRLEHEFTQNLRVREKVEVEVRKTVSHLASTESDLERAQTRTQKAQGMQKMLADLKAKVESANPV